MDKITPTHEALYILKQTIKNLELQYQALAATLRDNNDKHEKQERFLVHPLTGKKRKY